MSSQYLPYGAIRQQPAVGKKGPKITLSPKPESSGTFGFISTVVILVLLKLIQS